MVRVSWHSLMMTLTWQGLGVSVMLYTHPYTHVYTSRHFYTCTQTISHSHFPYCLLGKAVLSCNFIRSIRQRLWIYEECSHKLVEKCSNLTPCTDLNHYTSTKMLKWKFKISCGNLTVLPEFNRAVSFNKCYVAYCKYKGNVRYESNRIFYCNYTQAYCFFYVSALRPTMCNV